jgi:2-polyprenyl-3-methyl-5-hydroxy-6-metoxy-1,4-benzoquinol methylase
MSVTEVPDTASTGRQAAEQVCWICGSSRTSLWKARGINRPLLPEDLQITDSRYGVTLTLMQCPDCGFLFAHDDEVSELENLYEQLVDCEYEATQESRALQMRWLVARARHERPAAQTLLDVGAGTGLLMTEARRLGIDATGIEPSRSLVQCGRQVQGDRLMQGTLPHEALKRRRFDLITLVDVIEHVADPVSLLTHCREALTENGLLVVVTPDVSSIAARLLRGHWWHFRLAHVGYFNSRTLRLAASRARLTHVRHFRARWFFPVRYLAERLAVYLPIGWLNSLALKTPGLRRAYSCVVPLNLRDSLVSCFTPDSGIPESLNV